MNEILNYMALGANIRKYRKASHLTQSGLSRLVGISTSFLGYVERGTRKLSVDTFIKIAHALSVSANDLLETATPQPVAIGAKARRALHFQIIREELQMLENEDMIPEEQQKDP